VLYNLIRPVGWRVGLVRIEDVAIGFVISLGVGLAFWPRGTGPLLRKSLALAYTRNADFVVAAVQPLVNGAGAVTSAGTGQAAAAAVHRLDDAFRQYLAEPSPGTAGRERIATLVAGVGRVQRTAQSLSALAHRADGRGSLERCGTGLEAEVGALRSWYVTLGEALAGNSPLPPPQTRRLQNPRLLECAQRLLSDGDETKRRRALDLLWASGHLDMLRQLERHIGGREQHADRAPNEPAVSGGG